MHCTSQWHPAQITHKQAKDNQKYSACNFHILLNAHNHTKACLTPLIISCFKLYILRPIQLSSNPECSVYKRTSISDSDEHGPGKSSSTSGQGLSWGKSTAQLFPNSAMSSETTPDDTKCKAKKHHNRFVANEMIKFRNFQHCFLRIKLSLKLFYNSSLNRKHWAGPSVFRRSMQLCSALI